MATTTPAAALVPVAPVLTNTERLALAGFRATCSGLTRQAYEPDLRRFAGWYYESHATGLDRNELGAQTFAEVITRRSRRQRP